MTEGTQETPASPAPASAPTLDPQVQVRQARRGWLGRAWPILLVCALLMLAVNLWLSGGQIGYLAKRLTGQPATLRDFWAAGARAFMPLLGGTLLSALALGALVLIVMALSGLAALGGKGAPDLLARIIGFFVGLTLFIGFVWLIVRVSFWFIAIVTDQVGPVAGLKASFRATRRRFWPILGLVLLLLLISVAVQLPFRLIEWIGNLMGGGAATILGLLANLGATVANIFVGFVLLGAYIRFYEDVTSPTAGGGSPSG